MAAAGQAFGLARVAPGIMLVVAVNETGVSRSLFFSFLYFRRPSSLGEYPVAATSAVGVFAAARRAAHSSSDCW